VLAEALEHLLRNLGRVVREALPQHLADLKRDVVVLLVELVRRGHHRATVGGERLVVVR
jgi:hypothetical protein